jgi:biotin transport system substrate-specific component
MTIAIPGMNRLPADQRGITLGDFLVPVRLSERLGTRLRHIVLIVLGALFIALCAQLTIVQTGQTIPLIADFRIQLASSPVPITGQTFAVLLVGGSLGLVRGVSSVGLYLLLGLFLPVYAGGGSGLDTFVSRDALTGSLVYGPTAGYLVGFMAAAAVTGRLAELGWDRKLLGAVMIYAFGVPWLAFALDVNIATAIALGLTPFIIADLIKLLAAAGVFRASWWVIGRRSGER